LKAIDIFYQIKPAIPRRLQIAARRAMAAQKRKTTTDIWPIDPAAGKTPRDWKGWPERKKFALVLQHDVDSLVGLTRCLKLMDLEQRLGFRSSFNFVPEDYPTPFRIVRTLSEAGFEVGVHGLKHDGKLFRNPADFCAKLPRINGYLRKWGAVGFTSPSMLRKLNWIAELDIEHSCSTFDTDPFEPQSDGVASIFPLLTGNDGGVRTYVELPYTLPQDHGLFVILKEKDIRIWKQKLDWIAEHGGMAALNTHPDYMAFEGNGAGREEYPVGNYLEFLDYVRTRYAGQYWHVLPREMARFWRTTAAAKSQRPLTPKRSMPLPLEGLVRGDGRPATPAVKVWIDLDNTPHVPFFIPIIRELERRGHEVVLTARDAFQVCDLAQEKGLTFRKIGRHYGKNPLLKISGLVFRSLQLLPFYMREKPGLSLSHGARSQNLLSNLLGLPTVLIADYEHARTAPFTHPRWTIVPDALSPEGLPSKVGRVRYYRGIKEDVYVPEFKPAAGLMAELGLREDEMIVTVRPPANEAHYYNPESDRLFHELMARVCRNPGVRAVLLPRNAQQEHALRADFPAWFEDDRTVIPARAIDGLDLLWISDLVVSGGGTMNREAAALGVPVYSIFRGKTGAVDLMLEEQGRLSMIRSTEEVWTKILFVRRDKGRQPDHAPRAALQDIVDHIENIIRIEGVRDYRQGPSPLR
jgi:predicted glycosyltransferase